MTITTAYAPESFDLTDEREYAFTFPAADDGAIEVYEIISEGGTEYRYLVPVQDYTLAWNSPAKRYPLKRNGVIKFSRRHSTGTIRVQVERNTLIDQTIDFPTFAAFNGRMVEFALDKATMIFQEIADRKCDATTTTPITQEISFSEYDDFQAGAINFAVQKLYDIAAEIDASGEDCSDRPEDA